MSDSIIERAEAALQAEWDRQAKEIYFWDDTDKELLTEGPREWRDFQGGIKLADRFDRRALVEAVIAAL